MSDNSDTILKESGNQYAEPPMPDEPMPKDGAPDKKDAPKKGFNFNFVSENLVKNMSDVQEHTVNAHLQKEAEEREIERAKWAGLVDKNGNGFDPFAKPQIHRTKKDGSPSLSRNGKLILLNKTLKNENGTEQEQIAEAENAMTKATSKVVANTIINICSVVGGEEWRPIEQKGMSEREMLEEAFFEYFKAKGVDDIPPSLGLGIALSAYAIPRFTMPVTRSKFGKLKDWIVRKIADRKLKKYGLKAQKAGD